MRVIIYRLFLVLVIVCTSISLSCGKSKDSEEAGDEAAQQSDSTLSVAIEKAPFKDVLDKAGFAIISIEKFPTAEAKRIGQAVVYRSNSSDRSGGILYFKNERERAYPTWHWYFDDSAPEGVQAVELNEDGLWDMRISMSDASEREFLQEEEFTLFAQTRSDWIALNGTSSSSTDPDHLMWKCLDGRANTSWHSSLDASGEVFLEVLSPFGIHRGLLTLHTIDEGRPRECELYIDDKMIKQFILEDQTGLQKVQIGADHRNARKIRFVVRSTYAGDGRVHLAEFILE
jgi:hypothetical protein